MACTNCNQNRKFINYTQNCRAFNVQKRAVQFNDIPLEGIASFSLSGGFKVETTPFTADHGDYYVMKNNQLYVESMVLELDLEFPFKSIRKEDLRYYRNYIIKNLSKAGKLWFVESNMLYWVYAIPTDWDRGFEIKNNKKVLSTNIRFIIPSGVLTEADPMRTFLMDYNLCDFLEDTSTDIGGVCTCNNFMNSPCPTCMECEILTEENTLCYNIHRLDEMFSSQCNTPYKIVYNCEKARKLFDCDDIWGDKFCFCDCIDKLYESFYSSTVINTKDITIRLVGHFKDPEITLNNVRMKIWGEYHGIITIKDSTTFTYRPNCYDCECEHDCDFCANECYIWDEETPVLYPDCQTELGECEICYQEYLIDISNIDIETCTGNLFEIVTGHNKLRVTGNIANENQCSYVYIEHMRKTI